MPCGSAAGYYSCPADPEPFSPVWSFNRTAPGGLLPTGRFLFSMELYSEEHLLSLPEDPVDATIALCEEFMQRARTLNDRSLQMGGMTALTYLRQFVLLHAIPIGSPTELSSVATGKDYVNIINQLWHELRAYKRSQLALEADKQAVQRVRAVMEHRKGLRIIYEFSEADHELLQKQINQLRDTISKCPDLTDEHRQRLLARVEKVQAELHKKVSNIDQFWGLLGETTIAVGKFGKAADPILIHVKQIADTVFRTIEKVEGLVYGPPQILPPRDTELKN